MTYRILVQSRRKPERWHELWRGEDREAGAQAFQNLRRMFKRPACPYRPPAMLYTDDPAGQRALLAWRDLSATAP